MSAWLVLFKTQLGNFAIAAIELYAKIYGYLIAWCEILRELHVRGNKEWWYPNVLGIPLSERLWFAPLLPFGNHVIVAIASAIPIRRGIMHLFYWTECSSHRCTLFTLHSRIGTSQRYSSYFIFQLWTQWMHHFHTFPSCQAVSTMAPFNYLVFRS